MGSPCVPPSTFLSHTQVPTNSIIVPATPNTIGNAERETIAYCTKSGRGARTIPNGALQGVHFVKTHDYVQITGVGDLTKINVLKGDAGGELDNRGADGVFVLFSLSICLHG